MGCSSQHGYVIASMVSYYFCVPKLKRCSRWIWEWISNLVTLYPNPRRSEDMYDFVPLSRMPNLSYDPLVLRFTGPTTHQYYIPLALCAIGPKLHWSYGLELGWPTSPTVHWSSKSEPRWLTTHWSYESLVLRPIGPSSRWVWSGAKMLPPAMTFRCLKYARCDQKI